MKEKKAVQFGWFLVKKGVRAAASQSEKGRVWKAMPLNNSQRAMCMSILLLASFLILVGKRSASFPHFLTDFIKRIILYYF